MKRTTLLILSAAAILLLCGAFGLWQLMLETGQYPSSHGFRIDGAAYRAIQAAQKTHPGTHLVVETQGALVGPEMYMNIHLAREFDPRDCVQLTTRGLTIEVEHYLYEQRILRPVISHDGDDPADGYTLTFSQ
jgi:hypothetical protein